MSTTIRLQPQSQLTSSTLVLTLTNQDYQVTTNEDVGGLVGFRLAFQCSASTFRKFTEPRCASYVDQVSPATGAHNYHTLLGVCEV